MTSEDPADALRRWLAAGGEARVLSRSGEDVVVGLFTCDGGEEMGRVAAPEDVVRDLVTDH